MFTPRSVLHHTRPLRLLVIALLLVASALQLSTVSAGATILVDTPADNLTFDGLCSLREAIRSANLNVEVDSCAVGSATSADTISVPAGTFTISLAGANEDEAATGDLDITGLVTIGGAGTMLSTINGGQLDRVFHVLAGATAHITGLTVTNGLAPRINQDSDHGGGIYNQGALTVSQSRVTNNAIQAGADGSFAWDENGETVSDIPGGNGGHGGGIYNHGTLTLTDSTVANNAAGNGGEDPEQDIDEDAADGGSGGGLFNQGTMTIGNSAITGNRTGDYGSDGNRDQEGGDGGLGGGIYNQGTLDVTNSTVSGNVALCGCGRYDWPDRGGDGGGISNHGALALTSVTISRNVTGRGGGGLHNADSELATTNIRNSVIAGNSVDRASNARYVNDCVGTLTSQGHNLVQITGFEDEENNEREGLGNCTIAGDTSSNLIGVDPMLGPLQDNRGPTFTHALLAGSPAIDAGSTDECPAADQRSIGRPKDGNNDSNAICDMGAYEREPVAVATATATPTRTANPTLTSTATAISLPTATGTVTSLPTAMPTRTPDAQPTTGPSTLSVYLPLIVNMRHAVP